MRASSCLRCASGLPAWLTVILCGIVVVSSSSPVILAQEPDTFDVRLFRLINSQQNPDRTGFFEVLDNTSLISFVGVPAGFLGVGAIEDDSRDFQTGLMLVVSEGLTAASTGILKMVVDRPRPFQELQNVQLKHEWSAGGRSFPSGHTSLAFSIATLVSLQYRSAYVTAPIFAWALLTGYGRIYLGVHYPSDVLAGALLGTGVSVLVWQFRDAFEGASDDILGISDPVTQAAMTGTPVGVRLVHAAIPFH
jgi:hypothetical protein